MIRRTRPLSHRVRTGLLALSVGALGGVAGSASTVAAAASAPGAPLTPGPAWFRPAVVDGMAFPVARSNWLAYLEILSNWHAPRLRLVGGRWVLVGVHEGIDIAGEEGTPVLSMTPGTVENAGWTFYSGTRVGVRGADGRYYLYAHLSEVAPGISPGAKVSPGTMLGLLGNTGYGPPGHRDEFPAHLHFGIEGPGGWEDPYPGLVKLYTATVGADGRGQSQLASLASSGRTAAWRRASSRLFTDFGLGRTVMKEFGFWPRE